MSQKHRKDKPVCIQKDPFAYIALWQLLTFVILILLVWINEIKDYAGFFFNSSSHFNIFRAFLLTAAILVTAIIIIGNTYLQQQRVMKSLISVCSNCHRVRLNNEMWQKMEEYVGDRSLMTFTHGLCPDCTKDLMKSIEEKDSEGGERQHG